MKTMDIKKLCSILICMELAIKICASQCPWPPCPDREREGSGGNYTSSKRKTILLVGSSFSFGTFIWSLSLTYYKTPSINAQCRSIPLNSDQCRSIPLNSNQCQRIPINANQRQIKQNWSGIVINAGSMFLDPVLIGMDRNSLALIGIDQH